MALNTARVRLKKLESLDKSDQIQQKLQKGQLDFQKMSKREQKLMIMSQTANSRTLGFGKF